MGSFSNGSLSVEFSNRRPLQNVYMPKYKQRKVSAVRGFPPGCGPNAAPENLKPGEDDFGRTVGAIGVLNLETSDSMVANGAGTSGAAFQMKDQVVGNCETSNYVMLDEIKGSGEQNIVGSKHSDIMGRQPQESETNNVDIDVTTIDALVEELRASVDASKKLVMEIGPIRTNFLDEFGSHGNGSVNNPVEIERDQSLDSYMGDVTTTVTKGFTKENEELLPETNLIGVDSLKEMKSVTDSGDALAEKELFQCNIRSFSSVSGDIVPETSIRPKDKFRPRRVSAVRDFPPLCGVPLAVKEKQTIISKNDCLVRTKEVESAPSAAMLTNVSKRETAKEVLMNTDEGYMIGLEIVPLGNDTTEIMNNDAGRGLPTEEAINFENCSSDLQQSVTEKTGASPGSGTISKEVMDSRISATGRSVGKEIAVCSPDTNDIVELCHESNDTVGTPDSSPYVDNEDCGGYQDNVLEITPISMCKVENENSYNDYTGPIQNDVIAYSTESVVDREVDHGLVAAPNCPKRKGKSVGNVDREMSGDDKKKQNISWRKKTKARKSTPKIQSSGTPSKKSKVLVSSDVSNNPGAVIPVDGDHPSEGDICANSPVDSNTAAVMPEDVKIISGEHKRKPNISWQKKVKARKSTPKLLSSGESSKKKNKIPVSNDVDEKPGTLISVDDEDCVSVGGFRADSPVSHKPREIVVNLPPFGTSSSGPGDARMRVREILRHFYTIYRKSLQQEEANSKPEEEGKSKQIGKNRIDLSTAKFLKEKGKVVNSEKIIGPVPGVEVGDEFQYRVELAVVGIHFPYQSGIDSTKINDVPLCTSIVASGGYSDNLDDADVLIYSGQGGNVVGSLKTKEAEDQKLERGNLALKNCIEAKTPVRVVRGWKESKIVDPLDAKPKLVTTYIYDGLYTVTDFWSETGPRGKQVFQFKLERNPGQPELAWKELKKSNKFKTRPGTCVLDITEGKESMTISAVNTIDDQKPPSFKYISKMMYPNWLCLKPPQGCDCNGRCSKRCPCAEKNGGEIPYNRNGALVETKTVVYECGPNCKCPPTCYNRASQHGIKYKLEIFKTESRGWGVRPLTSIPSGSFICEYAGELLEDKEAEQRIGNDEYLFDIGHDVTDEAEGQENDAEITEEAGYTIDACQYGNVGRFINHSCLPNLHAQNVTFDHDNRRMPHIMFFAMENIPPLQELTYHYNYHKGGVRDSDGNVKAKECYCGAEKCDGQLY